MAGKSTLSPQEAASAADVLAAVHGGGHHVVFGAPGSGKSTLALDVMVDLAHRAGTEDLLLLAPTRLAADRLRNELSQRLSTTVGQVLVRTPASFAFSILRARAALLGDPPPALITGADQDATLAQLLIGHQEGAGRDPGWPQDVPTEALGLATFRHELRDVLMRAAEAGWDGRDLVAMGERHDRPAWIACGRVLQEYEEVTRLGETTPDRGERYDVATILDEAVHALVTWEDVLPAHPRPRLRAVVHDDYQDATFATARLLQVLADDGARLILLGDPDISVQTFRGAVPGLLDRATTGRAGTLAGIEWPGAAREQAPSAAGEFGASQHVLERVWRGDERMRQVVQTVTSGLPALGDARRRRAESVHQDADSTVRVEVTRSGPEEARLIARRLREHHLDGGIGWGHMVVVARSSGQLAALRRGLRAGGVPVATAQGEVPLAAEPAVRPLLRVLEIVDSVSEPSAEAVSELLLSPIGSLDAVGLRALRRGVRAGEASDGGTRGSDEVLGALLGLADDDREAALERWRVPSRLRGGVRRVARVLAAGREQMQSGVDLEHLLWAVWEATGLSHLWRDRALGTGPAAERADGDLDAVIALFRAAEYYSVKQEGTGAKDFLAYLDAQEFAADTLAATGVREAVPVITAAAAAGQEWSVVAIAGVQEDIWPDLRLRARLLDPVGIAEVAAGRSAAPPRPVDARRAVLADEQRLFAAAVSRARNHLLVTAVQDAEQRPSHFLDLVEERDLDEARTHTQVPSPLDLRGLVGVLRREVVHRGSRAQQAALLLARLAVHAVPGADPDHWWGHALSETSPLWAPDERVRVSPSALTTFGQCELRWALQRAGGDSGYSLAAEVGTLIHDIAAAYPRGDLAEMLAMLDATWPRLGLGEAWPDRKLRADAESMLQRLVQYQASVPGQVEVEVPFSVAIDRADLVGRVDRVEYLDETEDGAKQVRIVDLKTSKNPVSKDDAQEHPQLAAYQAAVAAGAFGDAVPGGARLVYLGKSAASATMRDQARPEDDWTLQMVAEAAETMSGATFLAQPGPGCRTCSVRTSCPAVSEGGRVMGR